MLRLVGPIFLLLLSMLYLGLLLVPFGMLILERRRTPLRWLLVIALGYAILAGAGGFLAYGLLPADYTKFHRWTLHPAASPLGEIHAVDLARMEQGAFSPSYAPVRRAEIRAERLRFAREWGVVAGGGLLVVVGGFAAWRGAARLSHPGQLSAG
jgi:hypothetical protein